MRRWVEEPVFLRRGSDDCCCLDAEVADRTPGFRREVWESVPGKWWAYRESPRNGSGAPEELPTPSAMNLVAIVQRSPIATELHVTAF